MRMFVTYSRFVIRRKLSPHVSSDFCIPFKSRIYLRATFLWTIANWSRKGILMCTWMIKVCGCESNCGIVLMDFNPVGMFSHSYALRYPPSGTNIVKSTIVAESESSREDRLVVSWSSKRGQNPRYGFPWSRPTARGCLSVHAREWHFGIFWRTP